MDEIPNLSEEEIEQYLNRDINDLYIMLSEGVPIIVDGRLIQQTPEQALVRGRELFERVEGKTKAENLR